MTNTTRHDFDSLWDMSRPADTEKAFREILPAAYDHGDAAYLSELLTQIARAEGLQGRFDDAHETLDEAETFIREDTPRQRVRYLLERGRVFNSSQHADDARPLFLQAWEMAREYGEDYYAVDAAHMMGIVEPPQGQLPWNLKALEVTERSADPRVETWFGPLYNNIGWTYHDMGDYETALDYFQRGLDWRQRQQGQRLETRIAAWAVARALRSLGRYDEALAMQTQNLQDAQANDEPDGFIHEEIGEALLALDRRDKAGPHFARAYEFLSEDPWFRENEPERLERLRELGGDTSHSG